MSDVKKKRRPRRVFGRVRRVVAGAETFFEMHPSGLVVRRKYSRKHIAVSFEDLVAVVSGQSLFRL